jgi:putative addiction module component (TIGR02574 family)
VRFKSVIAVAAQKQLTEKVLAWPQKARARLAPLLIKSLDEPAEELSPKEWDRVWKIELNKRMEEIRSGKAKTVPADRVMAELRAK